jgi:hypothetical protein
MMEALIAYIYVYTPRSKSQSHPHSSLFLQHHSQLSLLPVEETSFQFSFHSSQYCTVINSFIRAVRGTLTSSNKNVGLQRPSPLCVFLLDNFIEIQFVVGTREGGGGFGDEWTRAVTTSRLQQPLAVLWNRNVLLIFRSMQSECSYKAA